MFRQDQEIADLALSCSVLVPPNVFETCLKEKYITYLANQLNISIAEATRLFNTHVLLLNNQDYSDGRDIPAIGTLEWVQLMNDIEKLASEAPEVSITFQDILDCLKPTNTPGHTYSISIGVDDPTNGGASSINGADAGHAFITLTEKDPNGNVVASYTFDFYPNCEAYKALSQSCYGALGNDGNHETDVSWTFELKDFNAYMSVINGIPGSSATKWSFGYNCTNFAKQCLTNGGIDIGPHMNSATPHLLAKLMNTTPPNDWNTGTHGVRNNTQHATPPKKCK